MRHKHILIAFAAFAILLLSMVVVERRMTPDWDEEFQSATAAGEDLSRFEVERPDSGHARVYRIGETPNTLRIIPGGNSPNHYYLRLVDASTGHPVVDFFVQAGHDETVEVPNGVMRLHEATGTSWYGYNRLFGPKTVFTEMQTNIVFDGDSHYVVHFNCQNGNISSKDIMKRDF